MSKYNLHYPVDMTTHLAFSDIKGIKAKLDKIMSDDSLNRPKPDRNYDQFIATTETILQRGILLSNIENIRNKSILFLGDDDLTSIALSLMCSVKHIHVIDIDKRILAFINGVTSTYNLPIQTSTQDVRNTLPRNLRGTFDVVFYDPAYTPKAVSMWTMRAIEATIPSTHSASCKKPDILGEKVFFMCYGYTDRSTERGLKIQDILSHHGLIIQEKLRGFNRYYTSPDIGGKSDLYIVQPTPQVSLKQYQPLPDHFYTGKRG